eukprot:CAMPEP_0170495276 /NCGR_PEP_ID=MMETSP0208-20121228/15114_1 /TAXON_ID=197538 /ORGANISM="Strombidium inclinatum, Strain S3" /LENGTH=65 /DNA_ID=CAMNT_0010771439 /DNA_START=9 /DNA_END=206 /DNA_ORIENTATION=-
MKLLLFLRPRLLIFVLIGLLLMSSATPEAQQKKAADDECEAVHNYSYESQRLKVSPKRRPKKDTQ